MSKKDVNKPGQFKLGGRNRPGKDTVPDRYKQAYAQEVAREERLAQGTPPGPASKARRAAAGKQSAFGPEAKRRSR